MLWYPEDLTENKVIEEFEQFHVVTTVQAPTLRVRIVRMDRAIPAWKALDQIMINASLILFQPQQMTMSIIRTDSMTLRLL